MSHPLPCSQQEDKYKHVRCQKKPIESSACFPHWWSGDRLWCGVHFPCLTSTQSQWANANERKPFLCDQFHNEAFLSYWEWDVLQWQCSPSARHNQSLDLNLAERGRCLESEAAFSSTFNNKPNKGISHAMMTLVRSNKFTNMPRPRNI